MNILYSVPPGRIKSLISTVALIFFMPFLLYAVYNAAVLISRATGKPADITVDASIVTGVINNDFYLAFAQGGEESKDMLAAAQSQIKALSPKTIRIDHIYDHYDVVTRNGETLVFDFARLDAAVNSILATGARPFLALSYMPSAIAAGGIITNPPNNWADWSLVVKKTIEHYSGKNNLNLPDMHYEVWNEPDLEQFGGWKTYGDKNYLTLYAAAASGAKAAENVRPFLIGGPATTGLYQNWILKLAGSGQRIDFFSWHSYLENPGQLSKDQQNVFRWLQPYPRYVATPKIISEFGFTGAKDVRYQTAYAASYTIAAVRRLMDAPPKYLFTFQLKDGPNQESGTGWGLLAHENNGLTKKPRYQVFPFLGKIEGNRLKLSGEGTWVTGYAANKGPTTQVMLVNFDSNGYRIEQVPVSIKNLKSGKYNLTKDYLFESGCAVDQPKNNSLPETIQINETGYKSTVCLPAHTAVILTLTEVL